MILESTKLKLEEISTVFLAGVADCYICKDLKTGGATLYTVLRVRDHGVIRDILEMYERADLSEVSLLDSFASDGAHVLVFPYRKERPLDSFYIGEERELTNCEDICINVILACMTSGLPWPLLYLVLRQRLLNLNKDDSVYLTYTVNLDELEPERRERDCVVECARVLMGLLEDKMALKADSYQLLQKKIANQSYSKFTELYRDIRIAAVPNKRKGLIYRFKRWLAARSDRIFGILFWVCLILGFIALAMLLSNIAFGDIPWLRLFYNTFKRIGTESLLQ
jgi:hypothetical protein